MDKQDKRDKRVVKAAVVAAILLAIALLAVGWFWVGRDDSGSRAGDQATGGPTSEMASAANADSDRRGAQPATASTAAGTQSAEGSPAPPSQGQPSQSAQTQSGQTQPGPSPSDQTQSAQAPSDQTQTAPTQGRPAAGTASSALPASPAAIAGATGRESPESSGSTAPAASQSTASTTAGPESGRSVLTEEQVAALPAIVAPSFDVVRVNELGDAVIAGRAAPRSVVIIYDGDREIGRVAADSRGEWVFVSDRPLVPGQHEIGLLSQSGPQSRLSDQVVVLIAPEPRQDIAGQPSEGNQEREKPLALLVPRAEIGATTVLQSPPAVVTARAPDDPASRAGQPAIASSTTGAATTTPSAPPSRPAAAASSAVSTSPATSTSSATSASGTAPVSIDVVDYDEAGRLIVSGRSTPQSDVRLYLDNQFVGTARTNDQGSFQVQPASPVEPGVYALRIDEVSPVGSVTARAETPFQRAREVADAPPGHSRVVVQPGNSLWRIARQVYGHGIQYTVIYQANTGQIRNPDLIYPGQIFSVPQTPSEVPAGDPS